jgi:hypothetical protein
MSCYQNRSDAVMKRKWLLGHCCRFVLIVILLTIGKINAAGLPVAEEYQVKAVFLFNFSSFITWPAAAFTSSNAPFLICILGQDPFQTELDLTVEGEKIAGRPVMVRRMDTLNEINACQILFVSQSQSNQLTNILTYLKYQHRPILTVSDIEGFVKQGGLIEFFKHGKKVRFMIDHEAAKKTGLSVSGNLLSIAEVVDYSK